MLDSALTYAISNDAGLRNRILAVVMGVRWSAVPSEPVDLAPVPVDALAWAVATDSTVFAAVKAALDGTGGDVAKAVEAGCTDTALSGVVGQALGRLG